MATTSQSDRSPYEAAGGAGGKFRKKPYRRHQATPYDRPPSTLRNAGAVPGVGSNGWLRKIVDPAQRLIAAGAHRLFASVFMKRLTQPPPPPPPQPPEADQDERDKQQGTALLGTLREQEVAIIEVQQPASTSEGGGFTELEKILKQKTFTRSEVDRLTALLHARTADTHVADEGRRLEDLPSKSINGKEEVSDIIGQDNGDDSQLTKTHVLDEDVASPAELAKAYMGSRPSKVAPSIPGARTQTNREDSTMFTYSQHALKSPVMSLVPRSSPRLGALENGYMTPRFHGRSAIYSMARTPYSRVLPTPLKSVDPVTDGYRGPSSSQAWEHGRVSGSNALKRRSSVFENDIGSVGPIRRIRQKPNLLSQRNLSLPVSGAGVTQVSDHPASNRKLLSLGEKSNFTDQSVGNEDSDIPIRNMTSTSSKSTEMASKILQQLDKIVSPSKERASDLKLASASEKLPLKLSPSKLRGQALKSLEHIDSSKFLEIARDSNKLDDSAGSLLHDAGEATSQKPDKVEQNGRSNLSFSNIPTMNGFDDTVSSKKDVIGPVKSVDSNSTNFLAHPASRQNRAFKMSAHEDFFDLDDDIYSSEMPTCTSVEGREKLGTSAVDRKQAAAEAVKVGKSMSVSEINAPAPVLKEKNDVATKESLSSGEKSAGLSFPSVPVAKTAIQSDVQAAQTTSKLDATGSERKLNAVPPIFGLGDKMASSNEQNAVSNAFGFGLNNGSVMEANKVPQFSFTPSSSFGGLTPKFGIPSDSKSESSNGLFSDSAGPTLTAKAPEFDKTDDKKDLKDGVVSATPEPTSLGSGAAYSATTTFSFGVPPKSITSSQSVSSPVSAELNATVTQKPSSRLSFASTTSNGASIAVQALTSTSAASLSMSTSATSVPASSIFKFGSSMSTSVLQVASTPSVALGEAKTKVDSESGNFTSNLFPGPSSANATMGSGIFGFSAPASASTFETKKQGSSLFDAANGPPQLPASASGTAIPALSQSALVQSGSSAASFSFGLSGNTGSSLFGPSSASKLFSGASFGMSSASSSVANSVSSSSSATSNAFGSWQSSASPAFGTSSASQSTGFSFSAPAASSIFGSSGSTSASSSTPVFGATGATAASNGTSVFETNSNLSTSTGTSIFGSTNASTVSPIFGSTSASPIFGSTGTSSASTFSFTSAAASTPSVPGFGTSNSMLSFGSVPSGNNDQMNAEDSMAEDTIVATTPSVPVFGQQSISPQPSAFMFNSPASSVANPFQFGSQQNVATPPNSSLFQASDSLGLGGGSFSLGTGGDKSGRKIIKVKHKQRRK